jgi:hypothetical protein
MSVLQDPMADQRSSTGLSDLYYHSATDNHVPRGKYYDVLHGVTGVLSGEPQSTWRS